MAHKHKSDLYNSTTLIVLVIIAAVVLSLYAMPEYTGFMASAGGPAQAGGGGGAGGGGSAGGSPSGVSVPQTSPTSFDLSIMKSGGNGVVKSADGKINCGSTCKVAYSKGSTVTLTAKADPAYIFSSWSGSCSGTSTTCSVTMNAAKTATAVFSKNLVCW